MVGENSAVGLRGRGGGGGDDDGGCRGLRQSGIGGREMQIENLRPPFSGGCISKKIGAGRE